MADGFVGAVTRRGRVVVVLGDCCHPGGACDAATRRLAADADVLVHEATLDDAFAALALERGHSTPADAARVAARAGTSPPCALALLAALQERRGVPDDFHRRRPGALRRRADARLGL